METKKTLTVTRKSRQGKAVNGLLEMTFKGQTYRFPTLENADFLIPEGNYQIARTFSPKFRKFLPELSNVPDRSGIRIHRGTIPEHSRGCILTTIEGMAYLDTFFNYLEIIDNDENIRINIKSETEI